MSSLEKYIKKNNIKINNNKTTNISETSSLGKYIKKNNININNNKSLNTSKISSKKDKEKDDQEWYEGWFKGSEAYNDNKGNWLTDTAVTIGSTVGDVGVNLVKGAGGLVEGVGDLATYGIADVVGVFGNETKANQMRANAKKSTVDEFFQPLESAVDKNSVFDDKSDNIVEGLGYVAAITAVGALTGGAGAALGASSATAATVGTTATTFISGMGNGITQALNDGATLNEARIYGAISGAGEAISELAFGGLGKASEAFGLSKGAFDDVLVGGLTKGIKNKMVKTVTQWGLKSLGEGGEEVISALISAAGKKITYMNKKEWGEIVKDEKLAEQFWMGALTSALAQSPSMAKSVKNGTDYLTGRTENEQKVYDSELNTRKEAKVKEATIEKAYNEQIKTYEDLGIKIKDRAKSVIMQKVENAYNEGTLDKLELSKKDLNKIEEQLDTDMEEGNISEEGIRKALGENFDVDKKKDKILMRSMYENAQKYRDFEYKKTDNEKVNKLMQSAVDVGFNNTSKIRKKVELIAKLTKDTDRQYRFATPEQLEQWGYNKDAGGCIDKSTGDILINAKSKSGTQFVVGHETTHIFDSKVKQGKGKHAKAEYSKEYQELQKAAFEYAKVKGIYDARLQSVTNAYRQQLLSEEQIKEELTGDLVGEFLFNDEKFIEQLSVKNKNIFQKIYDYIKRAYTMAKGTDEEKAFEELKSKFEKVYKTVDKTNNQVTEKGARYSLSDNNTKIETISDIEEKYKDKTKYLILSEHEKTNTISINNMVVKEELRNQGIGQSILNDVIEYANKNNKVITLTPTTEFNTQNRLKKWYKANGFVENKGKNTDFLISDTMYKLPDKKVQYSLSEDGKMIDNSTNEVVKLEASDAGTHGTLMAIHNLTADKLKGVLDIGGFPIPSIAITKDFNSNAHYGDISIIFDKETINPERSENKVYSRDAYTPRVPKTINKINVNGLKEVAEKLNTSSSVLEANEFNATTLDDAVENIKWRYNIAENYAKDNDIKYETAYKEKNYTLSRLSNKELQEYIIKNDITAEELLNNSELLNEFKNIAVSNYTDLPLSAKERIFNNIDRIILKPGFAKDLQDIKDGITQEVDDYETTKNMKKAVDGEKYNEYVRNLISPAFEDKKYIRNNKGYYTNNGYPRSFEQLYEEYNIDNIVAIMKELNDTGSESKMFVGIPEIAANASKRFKSIEEIKKNEYMLKNIGDEEYSNILKEYTTKLQELSEEAIKRKAGSYDNYFSQKDSYSEALGEVARKIAEGKKVTTKGVTSIMKKRYFDVTENEAKQIIEFLHELQNIPTNYFEAKPQRAIGFNEVQAVVIPNNADTSLKQELADKGLNVIEYDSSIEGDRQSKINELDEYKFSLGNYSPITGDDIAVRDMLKQERPTIEDEVGKTEAPTVEEVITQTPEEKEQGMKEKAKKYLSRSKTQFIKKIVEDFGTSKIANTKTLNAVVDSIREDIQENGPLTKEKADSYFNELYNNLVTIDTLYYDAYKDVKDNIRATKLYISDEIKSDIADYNEFRKRNMGTLLMTNDKNNLSVDSYYQEMSDLYPELFPEDITNPSDQLERISEVAKDITKVETNVAAYNDKYLGPDYRDWARVEFDKNINAFMKDIELADRYNAETNEKEKIGVDKETVKNIYKQLPDARKTYERVLAKELLTKEDKVQVDRLLNNEITAQEIPDGLNKKGIMNVASAKYEYDTLQKMIKEYQDDIRNNRMEQAKEDVGDLNLWEDKKTGFKYSRETAIRNIYDIAPENIADKVVNKYFRSYIEVNEKKVVDAVNGYNERIKKLNIGTKNKYEITHEYETKKVSESALVQLLGERKITEEDVKNSGADVTKIENAVKEFRNIYNELIAQVNEAMLDNGYAPMEYRKDYFPHFTEETTDTLLGKAAKLLGIDITNREELPTDIAGQTYQFKPGRTWFSNMLQRTTDVTDYDALKGFDKYVRGATDLIYHTGDIQNLRALSSTIRGTYDDVEIQNKITEIKESTMSELDKSIAIQDIYDKAKDKSHLSKFVEWLDNYTNLLAGKKAINDRGLEKELNRQMYKTMQDIESRIAANAIGGNIGVSLTNFTPLAQAWGEVKTTNLINGIWQTMKASIAKDNSFASESQFITRRRGTDTLSETTLEKVTKPINSVLEFADKFTSEVIVRARYNQNLQEGMSPELALQEADRYVAGLMADRGRGALPTQFSNKNPISKMINMFQVEVNNQWSYYTKDLPKNMREKANTNKTKIVTDTAMAYTKIMVGAYLTNELLGSIRGNSTRVLPDPIYIISELLKGLTDDDDDNDDDTVIEALTEVAGNVPFISLPASLLADSLGLDVGDIGRISVAGAIPNVADITKDLFDTDMTAGEKIKSIGGELADTVGASLILPYGGSQIKKTIKGLSLYEEDLPGSYTDSGDLRYTVEEDVGSKVQAALFGAYANPYAQDYIDSGFKTISKNNIDEMVGLDMNSTEYREYRKGLNQSSKTEDKLNYIDSLDLTDAQKNVAANNLNKDAKTTIDMTEYGNYGSYDEYKYARDYPGKYSVISQITDYDSYSTYKSKIADIKEQYNTSDERKEAVTNYIESLNLNKAQKVMLYKMAGGYSIKSYQNDIYNYIESLPLSKEEKYTMWEELFN